MVSGEGSAYDPASDAWSIFERNGAPLARDDHLAAWTADRFVVWGGTLADASATTTGGIYDPAARTWIATALDNAPIGTRDGVVVSSGPRVLIWGGRSPDDPVGGGAVLDLDANAWTPIAAQDAPEARARHTAVWTGSRMIVWGGATIHDHLRTGSLYNPTTDTWTATSTVGAPSPRTSHAAIWTGTRMLIWGGQGPDESGETVLLGSGALYDPDTDSWTAMSLDGAPSPRAELQGVWTGSRFIVLGRDVDDYPITGGIYDPATDSWTTTLVDAATGATPNVFLADHAAWDGCSVILVGSELDPADDVGTSQHAAAWAYEPPPI